MATPAKRKKPEDEKEFNLTLAEVEATGAELGISISVNEPPKKVGRPRKSEGEKKQRSPTGRPRGRPRIYPKDSTPKEPRPRGRPRIHPPKDPSTKRSRKPPAQSAAKYLDLLHMNRDLKEKILHLERQIVEKDEALLAIKRRVADLEEQCGIKPEVSLPATGGHWRKLPAVPPTGDIPHSGPRKIKSECKRKRAVLGLTLMQVLPKKVIAKTNGDSEEENGHESKVLSPSPGSFKFKIVLKDRSKAKASPGRPPVNGSPAKKPGRPRIHPPKEGPKKPRGRPRIHPPKVGPKRPRGRPRRVPQETAVEVNIADKEEESQTPQSVEPETESTPQE